MYYSVFLRVCGILTVMMVSNACAGYSWATPIGDPQAAQPARRPLIADERISAEIPAGSAELGQVIPVSVSLASESVRFIAIYQREPRSSPTRVNKRAFSSSSSRRQSSVAVSIPEHRASVTRARPPWLRCRGPRRSSESVRGSGRLVQASAAWQAGDYAWRA